MQEYTRKRKAKDTSSRSLSSSPPPYSSLPLNEELGVLLTMMNKIQTKNRLQYMYVQIDVEKKKEKQTNRMNKQNGVLVTVKSFLITFM